MKISPVTSTSDVTAVGAVAVEAATTMAAGEYWIFTADVDCYIAQGAAPTASAADGSMFVPAGTLLLLDGGLGSKLSVIQAAMAGNCSLTRVKVS